MMERIITVSHIMGGDGNILNLQKAIKEAIELGATKYHCHIQYSYRDPYIQMIEFMKELSEEETLKQEEQELKRRLKEIQNRLKL